MSYATGAAKVGRKAFTVVEIDLDYCSLTFGVPPCTASGAPGTECFNTRATTQAPANYTGGGANILTYRFCDSQSDLAFRGAIDPAQPLGLIPCLLDANFTPAKIQSGRGLGSRATVSVTLQDFRHHDRGIDKYVNNRIYNPFELGTFFGKLIARNPHYQGRVMRVMTGFIEATLPDFTQFKTRYYAIEKIDGPDSNGKVKITGKDLLKLTDDDRSRLPLPSVGKLFADISETITSLRINPATALTYPNSSYIRIGDEIILITAGADMGDGSRSYTAARAQFATIGVAHLINDGAQICKVFGSTTTQINVIDVVEDILKNYTEIPDAFIDKTLWDLQGSIRAIYVGPVVITEPTGVKQLLTELCEQCIMDIFWDDETQRIKLEGIRPSNSAAAVKSINDNAHIVMETAQVKDDPSERISQVWLYYDKRSWVVDEVGAEGYAQLYIFADAASEGATFFGFGKSQTISSRWFNKTGYSNVLNAASRIVSRYSKIPKTLTFALDLKDADLKLGQTVLVTTKFLQDFTGLPNPTLFQIISAKEVAGLRIDYEAKSLGFTGRYAFIAPDATPDYGAASANEKSLYAFLAPLTGNFSDNGTPYKVV